MTELYCQCLRKMRNTSVEIFCSDRASASVLGRKSDISDSILETYLKVLELNFKN